MAGLRRPLSESKPDMHCSSAEFTDIGTVRDHNEDAFLAFPEDALWIVADGMGGHQAGEIASGLICDTVSSEWHRCGGSLDNLQLQAAFELANRRIRQYGEETLPGSTLGSTMVALNIIDGRYCVHWIGDSRAYLLRNGRLRCLSRDHSQVAELVEQGLLSEEEAETHPLSNVITRALGVEAEPRIDQVEGDVMPGDRFLLCSDGISREFALRELEALLSNEPIEDISRALRHEALVKGCQDNITSVIVQIDHLAARETLDRSDSTLPVRQWVQ